MQQELFIAIFAGITAMLGWGFGDFFAKKTIDRVGSIVSLVWAHMFGTLALALVVLYRSLAGNQISLPTEPTVWSGLLFFGVLQMIIYFLVYRGFGKGQLAILSPVFASYAGLAVIISIIVFGEVVTGHLPLALVTIFIGILFLNLDIKALKDFKLNIINAPGLKEVGFASILAAFWTVSWGRFVNGQDWMAYALFMYAFMTLAAFLFSKFRRINLAVIKSDLWKFLVLIGVCEVIAYLAISQGFSATPFISIVALLSGAFSLPTILLARIFLKEKVTTIQTIGSLVIILGIIILSIK